MNTNPVSILFHIDSRFFTEPFSVWVDWDFPFLPRVGEYVNAWLWIKSKHINLSEVKEILTIEGEEDLKKYDGELTDWLYDVCIEDGYDVSDVSYYKDKDGKIAVYLSTAKKDRKDCPYCPMRPCSEICC